MQQSTDQVSVMVNNAVADLQRRSERMLKIYSFVPTDKLDWSPSVTARSSVRIVAHVAVVCNFVADALTGKLPENPLSAEEFFRIQGETEKQLAAKGNVVIPLKESTARLSQAIGTITAENIDSTVVGPFGPMSLQFLMTLGQEQLAGHTGQLEYLQTIWGDMDNHMN